MAPPDWNGQLNSSRDRKETGKSQQIAQLPLTAPTAAALVLDLAPDFGPHALFRAIFLPNPTRAAVAHFSLPRCPTITATTAKAAIVVSFYHALSTRGTASYLGAAFLRPGEERVLRAAKWNFAGSFRSAVELPDGFRTSATLATTLGSEAAQIQGSSPYFDRHVRPLAATSSLESFAHDISAQARVP